MPLSQHGPAGHVPAVAVVAQTTTTTRKLYERTTTMDEQITRNTRVHVTDGPYKGRSGLAIRPDGKLRGKPVWLVKLDGAFGGAAVETGHMIPTND